MNSRILTKHPLLVTLIALLLSHFSLNAQAPIVEYNTNAITAMRNGQWVEAEKILTEATNTYDGTAPTIFGPRFGSFWYNLGYCQLKLGKYEEAMKSFETCYTKYPNKGAAANDENQSTNFYYKLSLLKWADAAKGAEQWKLAIDTYAKFLKERDKTRDKYEPGVLYINVAISHFKLGNIKDGMQFLETAINNKLTFPTPNRGIMSGFQAMVEAVIKTKNEKALLDFLGKNRASIKLDPYEAYDFAPLFMKLAQDAKSAEMLRSTFELYSLVPGTLVTIDDIETKLDDIGNYPRTLRDGTHVVNPESLKQALAATKKKLASGEVNEIYAYLNTAVLHEQAGNVRGAFAVYQQLERYFPNAKIYKKDGVAPYRENNLYNLVRTASIIGEVLTTAQYGERFLKAFPDSQYVPEVRRLMLASLFWEGQYAKCIEVASVMIDSLKVGSPEHDICIFVLGGSYYYTGEYGKAQPLIDQFLKTYPEDKTEKHRFQAASYFQASNLARLQEWTKSAALLDAFIAKFPDANDNPYLPFALFDRASAHFAEDEFEPALAVVQRLKTEFPSFQIMEMVYNLEGNIQQTLDNREGAEESYNNALALAETKNNRFVAGEALYYLVVVLGEEKVDGEANPRLSAALPYYDQFFKEYADESPYKPQVAVAGLPAMIAAKRTDEGLENLQKIIAALSKETGNPNLEESINSYTDAYLTVHTVDELKNHFYNFPGIDSTDAAARALLRIAVIGVVEDQLVKAEKENRSDDASKYATVIKVLFNDLKNEFNPKDLTNFILVNVGDFLRQKTSAPQQAKPYYEEVVGREDASYRFKALFGLADVLGGGSADDKAKAVEYLKQVYAKSDDKADKEMALYRMISVLYEKGDYNDVVTRAKEYLGKETGFRKYGPYVQLFLGQAYEELGKNEDAMVIYSQVWGTQMGFVQVSAQAILSWSELVWDRNGKDSKSGKSDRQFAYESLYNYLKLTSHNVSKMEPSDVALWEKVEKKMKQFEAHSDVTRVVEEKKK